MVVAGDAICFRGWKQGLSWDEKLSEKGYVKQTTSYQAHCFHFQFTYTNSSEIQGITCGDLFECNSVCIEWNLVCDGYVSCQDGSDEDDCQTCK